MAWIEETDRSSTIPVSGVTGCNPGEVLSSITGALSADTYGKKVILASSWTLASGASYELKPFGTCIPWLESTGGACTKTWGRVTGMNPDGFALTDGNHTVDVLWSGEPVQIGGFVIVTGGYIGERRFQAAKIE